MYILMEAICRDCKSFLFLFSDNGSNNIICKKPKMCGLLHLHENKVAEFTKIRQFMTEFQETAHYTKYLLESKKETVRQGK